MTTDLHQLSEESKQKQLCVSCLAPNDPTAHFCVKCAAPLSSYASTGPFERLFAEGAIYRQAAQRPRSLVVVLGVWLIFGAMAAAGVLSFLTSWESSFLVAILCAGILSLSVVMIWKTTRNYMLRNHREHKENG